MKKIKSFFRFVFVYKPLRIVQAHVHATRMKVFLYWLRNGLRRTLIVAIFAGFMFVSATAYRQFNPKVTLAETTVEVQKEYGLSDLPILQKICNAESGGKQFLTNGSVVRGRVNHSDIGICQINEAINNDQARKLGYDIFTEKGNVQMAVWMFIHQGTAPWNSSKDVWGK